MEGTLQCVRVCETLSTVHDDMRVTFLARGWALATYEGTWMHVSYKFWYMTMHNNV